jgi:LAO/AO transport system kinase
MPELQANAAAIIASILAGDRRALARLLTQIENSAPVAEAVPLALFAHTGRASLIGVTGPPGSGKSSLVNELAKFYRRGQGAARAPATVAIVAVDPSSPFTGGAILGDRIRMRDLAGDPGVFIRSMASRGSLGGLARATAEVVTALDAAGFEKILVETVGAGQAEVEIARAVHTTVVVEAPGLGDDVQAIKAGLLEVADILVVNKADQPGADAAVGALRASLDLALPAARRWGADGHGAGHAPGGQAASLASEPGGWHTPIVRTVAIQGAGIEELAAALDRHAEFLRDTGGRLRRDRERLAHDLELRLRDRLLAGLRQRLGDSALTAAVDRLVARETDPATAARELAEQVVGPAGL